MCGLTGFFSAEPRAAFAPEMANVLGVMTDCLTHRGPDDRGVWIDQDAGVAIGHRRLAILDLSPHGAQPMLSAADRYVLAFNGEIYNHHAIREELIPAGHQFRGHSDTEVLLAAFAQWGVAATLRKLNGMFAIALWDRRERVLHLVRDRIGKKPLYYGWAGKTLVFGSELKSLLAHPQLDPEVDPGSLALFLRHDYVPAPWCILRNVFKLAPAAWVTFDAQTVARGAAAHAPLEAMQAYWPARERLLAAMNDPFAGDAAAAVGELDALLRDAVRLRMEADVPLGAFLSGGTDSSTIVALMQAQSTRAVKTFTIGFEDQRHDEAAQARAVAAHLGTEHSELYVTGEDALGVVPQLAQMFDEPFADSSQIPTALVARLARRSVTVALSGDGGDELFCGYRRYLRALKVWEWHDRTPRWLRRGLAGVVAGGAGEARASKRSQLASELAADSAADIYLNRISRWRNPAAVVRGGFEHPTPFTDPRLRLASDDPAHTFMYLDLATYLPEDILTKVDRSTMAVSLEARAPLLDYRVVEFAWRLPLSMKIRDGQGKWILKELLRRYLPSELVDRPKQGFGAPVTGWLHGALRGWADALLEPARLEREGYFEVAPIVRTWRDFQAGQRKLHSLLWNILMFQAWLDWMKAERARMLARVRAGDHASSGESASHG